MPRLTEAQMGQLRELPLGIRLPGPEPWSLDDPEAFWVVVAGEVEVMPAVPGQVLVGGCRFAAPTPWKVVAVATGETRLLVGRLETLPGPARRGPFAIVRVEVEIRSGADQLTGRQALQMGTMGGARVLGRQDEIGSIEPGVTLRMAASSQSISR